MMMVMGRGEVIKLTRQGDSEDAMVCPIAGSGDTRRCKVRSHQGPEEAADPFRSRAVILGGDLAGDTRGEKIVDADGDQSARLDLHHFSSRCTN